MKLISGIWMAATAAALFTTPAQAGPRYDNPFGNDSVIMALGADAYGNVLAVTKRRYGGECRSATLDRIDSSYAIAGGEGDDVIIIAGGVFSRVVLCGIVLTPLTSLSGNEGAGLQAMGNGGNDHVISPHVAFAGEGHDTTLSSYSAFGDGGNDTLIAYNIGPIRFGKTDVALYGDEGNDALCGFGATSFHGAGGLDVSYTDSANSTWEDSNYQDVEADLSGDDCRAALYNTMSLLIGLGLVSL